MGSHCPWEDSQSSVLMLLFVLLILPLGPILGSHLLFRTRPSLLTWSPVGPPKLPQLLCHFTALPPSPAVSPRIFYGEVCLQASALLPTASATHCSVPAFTYCWADTAPQSCHGSKEPQRLKFLQKYAIALSLLWKKIAFVYQQCRDLLDFLLYFFAYKKPQCQPKSMIFAVLSYHHISP